LLAPETSRLVLVVISTAFERAAALFEEVHATDPRLIDRGGVRRPWSIVYHERLAHWVDALEPRASEPLRLAARAQHLGRWKLPRGEFPAGLSGYKRWRSAAARRHADDAEAILRASGYGDDVVERVRALLVKKGLKLDTEVQLLEDGVCLSFLELELADFARKHEDAKVIDILRKTWAKMSSRGHAAALALAATLPEGARVLVERAVADPSDSR
jgi:hypothetical protein